MKSMLLLATILISNLHAFAQYTYSHQETVSKGSLIVETNGINIPGGADFISLSGGNDPGGFYLNVSDGSGGYGQPLFYALPGATEVVTGDFNGDRKVDVVAVDNTENIYFYRGNQSSSAGFFDAPEVQPLGRTNASLLRSVAALDVNRDGKLDLVFATEDDFVYALGNGDGTFQTLKVAFSADVSSRVMTGNFNNPGSRADAALTTLSCDGQQCSTNVRIFFGNNSGAFDVPPAELDFNEGIYFARVLDIDSDGRADLVGVGTNFVRIVSNPRNVFDGKLVTTDVPLTKNAFLSFSSVDAADLNGDGRNDLVVVEEDNTTRYIGIKYAQADGSFSPEEYVFTDPNLRAVTAGRYNTGTKPDIAARTSESEFGPGTLHVLENTVNANGFPDCDVRSDPPTNVHICVPAAGGTYGPDIRFSIGGAFTSPLRNLEIWVDGAKRAEGFNSYDQYSFLDTYITGLSNGAHTASVYAVAYDGLKINQKTTFQVSVAGACPAPLSPGINICSPSTTATSPVTVNATGRTANTTIRMELWVDGTKRAQDSVAGNNIRTSIILTTGPHRFSFYAIDSSGTKINVKRDVTVN
jgi:hypothetical protein